jgi:putative transposase
MNSPAHKLSDAERQEILRIANSPEYRDLSPKQIVPRLADEQQLYIGSESTIYRVLREYGMLHHRQPSKPPQKRVRPRTLIATGPNQVWCWDITYLPSPIRGAFYYLYLVIDVWSRKIVGWAIHERECTDLASDLIDSLCVAEGISRDQLSLHSDNGSPMKGSTLLATLERLGVARSFSRPRVSNDNPFVEAVFRTVKYRPGYPRGPFASIEAARSWMTAFTNWYNHVHRHSGIRFVTPAQRHALLDSKILARRAKLWERARRRHPARWSGGVRNWTPVETVALNPEPQTAASEVA